ncbi:MAG: FtsH protease activity modulator HflK [Betaproteobacteria bacterium]|nr:FtsH protease activity modulator HflK [Betaproteobacteria bacterium]MDE2212278.1 FtsH protease activity modulator HflK [Betaproteobacteria bacterium]
MAQNDPQWGKNSNEGPPDLDEIWRRFIQKLKSRGGQPTGPRSGGPAPSLPGGKGALWLLLAGLVLVWLISGFYIVDAGRIGVILRFGKFQETTGPGPHWHLPYPIETQAPGSPLNVAQVRTVELGYRTNLKSKVLHESLMLTDDENIIDNQYAIQYTIKDPQAFLFNNRDPDEAVMQVAETAIREVVGRNKMDFVLYEGRSQIADESAHLMQKILDRYQTGIAISKVNMQNAQPPEQVQAAFDDAVKAGQDRERQNNEGQAYANDVIPRAKGTASRLNEEAKAYAQRVVVRAEGDASRFKQVLAEYSKAPEVTRQRLYQDMMQQVLSNTTKVVAEQKTGSSLLYLPLDKLIQASGTGDGAADAGTASKPATAPAPAIPAVSPSPEAAAPDSRSRDAFRNREREPRP